MINELGSKPTNEKGKSVAVLQSNYIPWKGYFDIINSVDEFIWYDDVQYTKNDWRNRNKIKTANGLQWITIPCSAKSGQLINEVELKDSRWQEKHWKTLSQVYAKAPYFPEYRAFFEDIYLGRQWRNLSIMNRTIIERICRELLGVKTVFRDSVDFNLSQSNQSRLLDLLEKTKAACYLSGPAAASYIEEIKFKERSIELKWMSYENYPEYRQMHGAFEHGTSIVDLLFNTGGDAPWYIWGWRHNA